MKVFKVIIAGGRNFADYDLVESKLDFILLNKTNIEIVSGACNTGVHTFTRPDGTKVYGADGLGEKYANLHGHAVKPFPANWEAFGKSAGPVRNKEMAQYVGQEGGCVCFWDGKSRGTGNMIKNAEDYCGKRKVFKY